MPRSSAKPAARIFIATMKSGTNAFHGTGYDYFVNEALNASTPFTNVKPRARRNDYGFTIGGPVLLPKIYNGRNRTFFFYNFEQFRENTIVNNVPLTVPTTAYRNGDFSQAFTGRNLRQRPHRRADPRRRNLRSEYEPDGCKRSDGAGSVSK